MESVFEAIVFWVSLVGGVIACIFVGWFLLRVVSRGKPGRFLATVIYGLTCAVTSWVPMMIAPGLEWLGTLVGYSLSTGARITMSITLTYAGLAIALAATVLFAAVMVFQALTGSGRFVSR